MVVVFESETGLLHDMGELHLESPVRQKIIKNELEMSQLSFKLSFESAKPATIKELELIHTANHIRDVQQTQHRDRTEFTPDTIANRHTWIAAMHAAGGTVQAAIHTFKKKETTFAMLRPPGHHATRNAAMGFCFFNNIALAAENLIQTTKVKRVAILDIDNHHGNGTQDIFYDRGDVLYASLHLAPQFSYPGTGYITDVGTGEGLGKTINFPLPFQTEDAEYLVALNEVIIPIIRDYNPDVLLVSLGLDGLNSDPYGGLGLTPDGFFNIGLSLASLKQLVNKRVCVVLEGGYKYSEIGIATRKFFEGLETETNISYPTAALTTLSPQFEMTLREAKGFFRQYWTNF